MYRFTRPLLFRLDPEQAHDLTVSLLRLVAALPPLAALLQRVYAAPPCLVTAFGLTFRNPIGLAAGYDKDGLAWRGLASLGFGHIEVGTITQRPQPGNPRPRVFRLPEDQALINRMGFPGLGADFVARRLAGKRPSDLIIGANLGKNKDTPIEDAYQDYLALLPRFATLADYLAINVSSPNTVGLRRLQAKDALSSLLAILNEKRRELELSMGKHIPLLVKLAPDLNKDELDDALDAILLNQMDGVIATNTTIRREALRSSRSVETGGLSGAPLQTLSRQKVADIYRRTDGKLPVIGVGGVMDAASAYAMLDAGAVLVQVYTGLIYQGPGLVKQILTSQAGMI